MTALPASVPNTARRGESRPIAIITGASSGIGRDFADLYARDGHDLVLVARRRDALESLGRSLGERYGIVCEVFPADLARRLDREHLAARMRSIDDRVVALVNNAGIGTHGYFHETDLERELEIIDLNIAALTHLAKLVLPGMLARRHGQIVNVSSLAAFQPGPLMAVYYASKAYVQSFSEALAEEVAGTGVTVTALCPGPTRTGFQARAQMEQSKLVRGREIMTAETVARVGYDGLMKGKTVVIPGVGNKMMAQAVRFLPRNTVTKLVRNAQERAPH